MESHWDVGARIRAIRRRRGLTQAALAARIGRSAAALSAVERGRNRPGFDMLRRLAAALGVPIADFFEPAGGGPRMAALHAELQDAARALSVEDLELTVRILRMVADRYGRTPEERPPPEGVAPRHLIRGD